MSSRDSQPLSNAGPAVGIDLGAAHAVVAMLDGGRPVSVPNELGEALTPSVVYLGGDSLGVGREALGRALDDPALFAESFARDFVRADGPRTIRNRQVPPEVLCALILEQLKRGAQRRLGGVGRAAIAVPVCFDERRRRAMLEAGRLAGWEQLDLVNDTTAAALAWAHERSQSASPSPGRSPRTERLLVFDLGGGKLSVAVVEIDGLKVRTLSADGNPRLGGLDFERRIVDRLAERFCEAHGIDPRTDPRDRLGLSRDARELVHALTNQPSARAVCRSAGLHLPVEMTRDQFETLSADLIERTRVACEFVVRQAGCAWSQVDRVVALGGASRMTWVGRLIRELSGRDPDRSLPTDEAVAHGAALYSAMLAADPRVADPSPIDLSSHSVGIVGYSRKQGKKVVVSLIPRGTPLPARVSRNTKTTESGQRSVGVRVVEGENERPEFCMPLGRCMLSGLPPDLPRGTRIQVEYCLGVGGLLDVSAKLAVGGEPIKVEIDRPGGGAGDLAEWKSRLLGSERAARESPKPPEPGEQPHDPAAPPNAAPTDRAVLIRKLDQAYTRLGRLAMKVGVPDAASLSQGAAWKAVRTLQRTRRRLKTLELKHKAASSAGLTPPAELLDQALLADRQAIKDRQFAYLVLGRDCANADFAPPRGDNELRLARKIMRRLRR